VLHLRDATLVTDWSDVESLSYPQSWHTTVV
jgi:hypothetical protein